MTFDLKIGELYYITSNNKEVDWRSVCLDCGSKWEWIPDNDVVMLLGCEKKDNKHNAYAFKILWKDKIGHIVCNVIFKHCKTGEEIKGIVWLIKHGELYA